MKPLPFMRKQMTPLTLDPAKSILQTDLRFAGQQNLIGKIKVMETPEEYYLIIIQFKSSNRELYLATRRKRMEPRLFKDLTRVNKYLKNISATTGFELERIDNTLNLLHQFKQIDQLNN